MAEAISLNNPYNQEIVSTLPSAISLIAVNAQNISQTTSETVTIGTFKSAILFVNQITDLESITSSGYDRHNIGIPLIPNMAQQGILTIGSNWASSNQFHLSFSTNSTAITFYTTFNYGKVCVFGIIAVLS